MAFKKRCRIVAITSFEKFLKRLSKSLFIPPATDNQMFFLLSKIFDFITNPVFWVLACLALALFLKKPLLKKRFLVSSILLLVIFSNPWITNRFLLWWEIPPFDSTKITEPYDVAVVLGGCMRYFDSNTNRVVYGNSVDRLLQAIELYQEKKVKKILLSGGSGYISFPEWREAIYLAEVLKKSCVPDSDIIIEKTSRNTRENAIESAKILQTGKYGQKFLLITSGTHMIRSLACFKKVGLNLDPYSVDGRAGIGIYTLDKLIKPDSDNLTSWDVMLHEWMGMVMYRVAGYI